MSEEKKEVVVEEENVEVPAEPTVEEKATAKGWRPKDNLKDPDDFVDAKEFLAREPIFNHMKDVKKQLSAVVGFNEKLMKQLNDAEERGRQTAISELEIQKSIATKEGDGELVDNIDNKINEQAHAIQAQRQQAAPPEALEFIQKHQKALQQDQRKMGIAVQAENLIRSRNPGMTHAEVFKALEKEMASELGIKENTPVNAVPKVNPVAAPTKGNMSGGGESFSIHDLSDEGKSVFQGLASATKDAGGKLTVADFVENARAMGVDDGLLRG